MNNEIILHNSLHPLLEQLKKCNIPLLSRGEILSHRPKVVWDFTICSTEEKRALFRELRNLGVVEIHSDLTCAHGEKLINEFEQVQSAFALACFSPQSSFELWQRNEDAEFGILEKLPYQPILVSSPGHAFIYPRVVATLINESRFARHDQLASSADLDNAMKYGVNYPLGLIEWENKIGPAIIDAILDDLKSETGSERYTSVKL